MYIPFMYMVSGVYAPRQRTEPHCELFITDIYSIGCIIIIMYVEEKIHTIAI